MGIVHMDAWQCLGQRIDAVLRLSHVHGADAAPPQFPFVCLLVSGGHNLLLLVHGVGDYTLMGTTVDDAMGAPCSAAVLCQTAGHPNAVHHGRNHAIDIQKAHNSAHPECHDLHQGSRAVRLLARSFERPFRRRACLHPVP